MPNHLACDESCAAARRRTGCRRGRSGRPGEFGGRRERTGRQVAGREGAATVGGSQFRFHSAEGSYDPASGAFTAGFSGGVRFVGHRKTDGTHELDLTISRPRVRIEGGRGTLYADMASRAKGTGKATSSSQVPLASLDLSGIDMRGGGSPISLTNVPTTLTTQGARAFAGYYTAGTPLDPISLTVDVKAAAEPSATKAPEATASSLTATGSLRDAAVDWGVRRTFREYVTGSIAQGRWTLSDGAQDGGALFRFPSGKARTTRRRRPSTPASAAPSASPAPTSTSPSARSRSR